MGENFPHIAFHFTKYFVAFCDVLQPFLRWNALRFTKQ